MGNPESAKLFIGALGTVLGLVGVFAAAPFLMRKVNRDLVSAQAQKTAVETDEIVARQAGVWIERYERRLADLDEYLDRQEEYHAVHAAWDYTIYQIALRMDPTVEDPPPLTPPKRVRTRTSETDRVHVDE